MEEKTITEIENGRALTFKDLLDAIPLTEEDVFAIYQPNAFNSIKQKDGDSRKLTLSSIQNYLNEKRYYVGIVVEQLPNQKNPIEAGLPGQWQLCNDLAYQYRLNQEAPGAYTTYTQGANYALGAMVMYHLAGDDWALYTAKEALTNVPTRLDPVKWTKVTGGILVEQRFLHAYTAQDFAIGSQVLDGQYQGYYVTEINVYGGKYAGVAGGNRGTFGSVAQDRIRNIYHNNGYINFSSTVRELKALKLYGPFANYTDFFKSNFNESFVNPPTDADWVVMLAMFRASSQVPTGSDNAPSSFFVNFWRRKL